MRCFWVTTVEKLINCSNLRDKRRFCDQFYTKETLLVYEKVVCTSVLKEFFRETTLRSTSLEHKLEPDWILYHDFVITTLTLSTTSVLKVADWNKLFEKFWSLIYRLHKQGVKLKRFSQTFFQHWIMLRSAVFTFGGSTVVFFIQSFVSLIKFINPFTFAR